MRLFHRLTAFAAGLCTAVCMTGTVHAENTIPQLPFDLNKPPAVSIAEVSGNAVNNIKLSFKKSTLINQWSLKISTEKTQIKEKLGLSDLWIKVQMDWSIDSYNDWHYNAYWDNDGYDADWNKMVGSWAYLAIPVTAQETDSRMIFNNIGSPDDPEDTDWNGTENAPGWKDVLKEGQYDIVTDSSGKKQAKIDLTKHAICVRIRWEAAMECDDWDKEELRFSEWSDIAVVGNKSAITDTPSVTTAATTTHTAVTTATTAETTLSSDTQTSSGTGQPVTSAQDSGTTVPGSSAASQSNSSDASSSAPAVKDQQSGTGALWAVIIIGFLVVAALGIREYNIKNKRRKRKRRKP